MITTSHTNIDMNKLMLDILWNSGALAFKFSIWCSNTRHKIRMLNVMFRTSC